jgi:dolichyl-phosphate-mannose--protein O-mannosyl transferase
VSFWGLQFAPWLLVPRPSFFFYMVPIVPFLALANAYAITWIDEQVARRRPTRAIMAVLIAIVAVVTLVLLVAPWYTASPRSTFWSTESLPWLLVPGMAFLFYMTPVVPFVALVIAYLMGWRIVRRPRHSRRSLLAGRPTPGTVTGAAVAVVAVALFVWFYPVYSGLELPYDEIHQRWWFDAWI